MSRLFAVPSEPNVAQTPMEGTSSFTVCTAVRVAMMLSVGVSLMGATRQQTSLGWSAALLHREREVVQREVKE